MTMFRFEQLRLGDETDRSAELTCAECGERADLHCGICTKAYYCSGTCQAKSWTIHKDDCKNDVPQSTLPPQTTLDEGLVVALHFGVDETSPSIGWLRYTRTQEGYLKVDLGNSLLIDGEEEEVPCEVPMWFDITRDVAYEVDLPYTIRVLCRDNFQSDDPDDEFPEGEEHVEQRLKVNNAIESIDGNYTRKWHGPAIAFCIGSFTKTSHIKELINSSLDSDEDARHVMNFFNSMKNPVEMVDCVRVNCQGDKKENGHLRFEALSLPANHAIFQQETIPIPQQIDLPLVAARIPGNVDIWTGAMGKTGYVTNRPITFLHQGCDPDPHHDRLPQGGFEFGWAPLAWQNRVGSCIVARKDGKSLHPDHVEALTRFCRKELVDIFGANMEAEYDVADGESDEERRQRVLLMREGVLKEITKDKFEAYFQQWKAAQSDSSKAERVSPYDV